MALPPPPPPPPPQDHHASEPPAMAPDLKDEPGQSAGSTLGPITLPAPPITLPAPGPVPSPPPAPAEQAQQVAQQVPPSCSMHDMPKRHIIPVQSAYSSDVHANVPMPPPTPAETVQQLPCSACVQSLLLQHFTFYIASCKQIAHIDSVIAHAQNRAITV